MRRIRYKEVNWASCTCTCLCFSEISSSLLSMERISYPFVASALIAIIWNIAENTRKITPEIKNLEEKCFLFFQELFLSHLLFSSWSCLHILFFYLLNNTKFCTSRSWISFQFFFTWADGLSMYLFYSCLLITSAQRKCWRANTSPRIYPKTFLYQPIFSWMKTHYCQPSSWSKDFYGFLQKYF